MADPAKKERVAFRRPQDTIEFAAGAPKSIRLHRGRQYRNLLLWLEGTIDVATAAATNVIEDAPYSLIKRIELIVNGNVPVKTFSGKMALERTALRNRVLPGFLQPGLTIGAHPFNALIELPLWLPEAGLAADATLVDASAAAGVQSVTLEVTWGQTTDLLNAPSANLSFSVAPTVQVVSHDLARRPGDDIPSVAIHRERSITQPVASSNNELKIDLKSGDTRRINQVTIAARLNGVRTNAIINKVRIESDVENRYQFNDEAFQRAVTDLFVERGTNRAGIYHIDISPRNLIGHAAEMSAVDEYNLLLDVNGAAGNELEILIQEFIGVARATI